MGQSRVPCRRNDRDDEVNALSHDGHGLVFSSPWLAAR